MIKGKKAQEDLQGSVMQKILQAIGWVILLIALFLLFKKLLGY
jgi:hypothetical protein